MTVQNTTLQNVVTSLEVSANCSGNNLVVKVLDVRGRIAKTIKQALEQSIDRICLNVEDLGKGNYIVNIFTDDSFVKAVRFIKD